MPNKYIFLLLLAFTVLFISGADKANASADFYVVVNISGVTTSNCTSQYDCSFCFSGMTLTIKDANGNEVGTPASTTRTICAGDQLVSNKISGDSVGGISAGDTYTIALESQICPGGTASGGQCWYSGVPGENCNTICSNNHTTTDDTYCCQTAPVDIFRALSYNYYSCDYYVSSKNAQRLAGNYFSEVDTHIYGVGFKEYCYYADSDSSDCGASAGVSYCAASDPSFRRICACQPYTGHFNFTQVR